MNVGKRTRRFWEHFRSLSMSYAMIGIVIMPALITAQDKDKVDEGQISATDSFEIDKIEITSGLETVLPAYLTDVGFDRYVDVRLLLTAYQRVDSALMTDIALQLVEGERVLQRSHRAISAKAAILAAADLAAKKGDTTSLKRLQNSATNLMDKEVTSRLQTLLQLASQSRAATPSLAITLESLTRNEREVVRAVLDDLERAKFVEGRGIVNDISEFIKIGLSIDVISKELAEKLTQHVAAVGQTIANDIKEDPEAEVVKLVARLSDANRGGIFGGNSSPPPRPETYSDGPKWAPTNSYNLGNAKVRFLVRSINSGSLQVKSMDPFAQSLMKDKNAKNHIRDDKWYRKRLDPGYTDFWMLVAHNTTSGNYRWVTIKNTPRTWYVLFSNGDLYTPGNGQQVKLRVTTNGYNVDLDVRNPDNTYRITADDILYGFGY